MYLLTYFVSYVCLTPFRKYRDLLANIAIFYYTHTALWSPLSLVTTVYNDGAYQAVMTDDNFNRFPTAYWVWRADTQNCYINITTRCIHKWIQTHDKDGYSSAIVYGTYAGRDVSCQWLLNADADWLCYSVTHCKTFLWWRQTAIPLSPLSIPYGPPALLPPNIVWSQK